MITKYGLIKDLTTRTVTIQIFHKDKWFNRINSNPYQTFSQRIYSYMENQIKIGYKDNITDKIIENLNNICLLEIHEGTLINLVKWRNFDVLQDEMSKLNGIKNENVIDRFFTNVAREFHQIEEKH